jgi:Flp pilus assembly pilin Flp
MQLVHRWRLARSGTVAIEYGMIAAGISIAVMDVIDNVAIALKVTFTLLHP